MFCSWYHLLYCKSMFGSVLMRNWQIAHIALLTFGSFTLYCWIAISNDYVVFDKSISEYLNIYFRWGSFILHLNTVLVVYLFLSLIYCSVAKHKLYVFDYCNKLIITFFGTLGIAGFSAITIIWYPELQTVKLFMQMTSPFISLAIMFIATLVTNIYVFAKPYISKEKCVLCLLLFFVFFFVPSLIYSPCIKNGIEQLPKPIILGHKGFPKLCPENTLLSFEEAIKAGADGLEADVAVSLDGVPFLIHDHTLKRTSNVHEVFPERNNDAAEMFTWPELQRLNAGMWFLIADPYGSVSQCSQSHKQIIAKQKVMSLHQLAHIAKQHKMHLIFDLRHPPYGNPYTFDYIYRIVDSVLRSGINQSQVMWISGNDYEYVLSVAPGFKQVLGAKPIEQQIKERKISMLILEYNTVDEKEIQMYARKHKLSTIVYTSSTAWTFSLAWCQEAYAVISDDPLLHAKLNRPIWSFSVKQFSKIWYVCFFLCLFVSLCNMLCRIHCHTYDSATFFSKRL